MSQNDFVIANAPGATVRSDMNSAYAAIASNSSGAAAPSTTYAHQWWADETADILKIRDEANTVWINVASKVGSVWVPYNNGALVGAGLGSSIAVVGGNFEVKNLRRAETGTTYTVADGDRGKHVTFNNAASIAVTQPQAGGASQFVDGWGSYYENIGAGVVTVTPTTSTISGGTALVLRQGEWAFVTSDGTNYRAFTSGRITGAASARELGSRGAPVNTQNAAYEFTFSDAGGLVFHDEVTARIYTIPANGTVALPIGTVILIANNNAAGALTIAITTDTLRRGDGTAGTGSRTVSADSVASIVKTKSTEWMITGKFT